MGVVAVGPTAPVGVFDPGVGGLSILRGIHQLLPAEHLLYVADSAHAPYGPKGDDFIRARCRHIVAHLLEQGVKAVVVACNTATAAAVLDLRQQHALPIVAIEPALKPAAVQSRSGVIGALATSGTIASGRFLHLQGRFAQHVEVLTRVCSGLVEAIEQIEPNPAALDALLHDFIDPLVARGADTLVLGCTHYSLVRAPIQAVAGPAVTVVDTGSAVARELQRRLHLAGLLNPDGEQTGGNSSMRGEQGQHLAPGTLRILTSGLPTQQQQVLARYWSGPFTVACL